MLEKFKCENKKVNLEDYLKLYKYVRDSMIHPEWLGTFTKKEIEDILSNEGKIWLYYDNENLVGSLGPIMVSPDYVGHGLQREMMDLLDNYCKSINKKYIFTKVCTANIYSLNNMLKNNFKVVDEYLNERGKNTALIKELEE